MTFRVDGLAYDAFRQKDGEVWMGTLSWAPSVRYFLFYVDARGGQGANALFNLLGGDRLDAEHDTVRILPSESYEGRGRVWALAIPGTDGEDGWMNVTCYNIIKRLAETGFNGYQSLRAAAKMRFGCSDAFPDYSRTDLTVGLLCKNCRPAHAWPCVKPVWKVGQKRTR